LLATASPLNDPSQLPSVVAAAESFGLRIKQFPSLTDRLDYTAGSAKSRASDLKKAFAAASIKGIACLRGGFGSAHMLPLLDFAELAKTPKLLVGYSDLTALLNPLATASGMISLHGPTMNYFLRSDAETMVARAALEHVLFSAPEEIDYSDLCGNAFDPVTLVRGQAEGIIVGGNVSVFDALLGTPWEPKGKGLILFLEEVGERPYRIDRYVTHMIQCGFMDRVAGIVLGQFTDCEPGAPDTGSALEVLKRVLAPLKKPVLAGLPVGHGRPSFPLPIGAHAVLDATRSRFTVRLTGG
jgi:muramoyltetrapeptide carboxypeptidase